MIFTGRDSTRPTRPAQRPVAHSVNWFADDFGDRVHVATSGAYEPGRIGGAA